MDEFSFKYVPEAELSKIVKEVKRERRKKNEEKEWEEFLERRKLKLINKHFKQKGVHTAGLSDIAIIKKDGEIQSNEFTQLSCGKTFPFTIDDVSGDGRTCKRVDFGAAERDFSEENGSLFLDLESAKKLDKLRIFDCPELVGLTCSSDHCLCIRDRQHHQHHHSHPLYHNSDERHHCQHISEHYHCHNHQNVCSAVSSPSRRTADSGDCVSSHGHLSDRRLPVVNCKNVRKPLDKSRSSISCINLCSAGRADNCINISNEQGRVLCNGNMVNVNDSNAVVALNVSPVIGMKPVNRDLNDEFNKNVLPCTTSPSSPDVSLSFTCNTKVNRSQDSGVSSPPLFYESVQSCLNSSSEALSRGNFHKYQKLGKTLSTIQEEHSVQIINDEMKSDYDDLVRVDKRISEMPSPSLDSSYDDYSNHPDYSKTIESHNVHSVDDRLIKNQVAAYDGELKLRINNLKTKLMTTVSKILDSCSNDTDDDDNDIERKVKQVKEFISRFSRNYLYQFRRQVEMIKKMKSLSVWPPHTLYQKLFLSYQISLQALQAFQNILPDRSKLSFSKIVEFLDLFLSSIEFFETQFDDTYENKEIKILCSSLIATLKNNVRQQKMTENKNKNLENKLLYKNDSNYRNNNDSSKIGKGSHKKGMKKQKSPKKLSMYCANGSAGLPVNWKKTSANLARKKFGSPNKKLSNDGNESCSKNCENNKNRLNETKNLDGESDLNTNSNLKELDKGLENDEDGVFSDKKVNNADFKDGKNVVHKFESGFQIQTPVEVSTVIENCHVDADDHDNLELPKDCEERTKIFLLFDTLSEMITQNRKEKEQSQSKNDEDKVKDDNKLQISEEEMKMVLQQIHEMYLHPESLGLTRSSLDKKCPIIIPNGERTVKKSTNNNNSKDVEVKCAAKNVGYADVQFNEEEHYKNMHKNSLTEQKNRAKNAVNTIPFVMLQISDEQLESILRYRDDFMNYTKMSPFYEQFDERWTIVKRIGDQLLSKLLSDVSKELEVNTLIQKMYDLEFTHQMTIV